MSLRERFAPGGPDHDKYQAALASLDATVQVALGPDDPDIGICDECGDTEETRLPCIVTRHIDGQPVRLTAWLCRSCERLERQP